MYRIIIGAAAGAIAVIIPTVVSYVKNKKFIKACKSEPGSPGAFEYNGVWYDRAKYVELRSEMFKENKVKEITDALDSLEKRAAEGRVPEITKAEIEALQLALVKKRK